MCFVYLCILTLHWIISSLTVETTCNLNSCPVALGKRKSGLSSASGANPGRPTWAVWFISRYLAGRSQTKWNRTENQRRLLELPEPLLIFRFGEGTGRGRQKCPEEETKAVRGPLGKCILNIQTSHLMGAGMDCVLRDKLCPAQLSCYKSNTHGQRLNSTRRMQAQGCFCGEGHRMTLKALQLLFPLFLIH